MLLRAPRPALRPFVKTVWALDEQPGPTGAQRELVLPTGNAHLVFRLSDLPLRVFDTSHDPHGRTLGHSIVGGPRAAFYVRDVSRPVRSVGAELLPGAALALFGVGADELAGRHTPLDDLWGAAVREARERLLEADTAALRLEIFESLLAARLPRLRGLHPAVAHALERFVAYAPVRGVVRESGLSHRRFIDLFRRAVGLPPKLYCRVQRFSAALDRVAGDAAQAELALDAGYSDQSHFHREFRELAGLTPGRYRELAPERARHVPVRPAVRSAQGQFRTRPQAAAEPGSSDERRDP
jgi:AraC-like DNA-binding protein